MSIFQSIVSFEQLYILLSEQTISSSCNIFPSNVAPSLESLTTTFTHIYPAAWLNLNKLLGNPSKPIISFYWQKTATFQVFWFLKFIHRQWYHPSLLAILARLCYFILLTVSRSVKQKKSFVSEMLGFWRTVGILHVTNWIWYRMQAWYVNTNRVTIASK